MIFLVVLATLAGFVMANNILGTRIRTITVRDGDSFYVEPSVTAMSATSLFQNHSGKIRLPPGGAAGGGQA